MEKDPAATLAKSVPCQRQVKGLGRSCFTSSQTVSFEKTVWSAFIRRTTNTFSGEKYNRFLRLAYPLHNCCKPIFWRFFVSLSQWERAHMSVCNNCLSFKWAAKKGERKNPFRVRFFPFLVFSSLCVTKIILRFKEQANWLVTRGNWANIWSRFLKNKMGNSPFPFWAEA